MLTGKLIGSGNTAEVYEFGDGNLKVIKLFYERMPFEYIKQEYDTSKRINQLGIPSPHAEELLVLDHKWGIIYEKVSGRSFTQVLSSQPLRLKKHALIFAELQSSFHKLTANHLTPQKEYLSRNISGTSLLSKEEKQKIFKHLKQLPDDNKVCHGDYHPENIMMMDGKPKILDWMTGSSGDPCADAARTLIIMRYSSLPPGMSKLTKLFIQTIRKRFCSFYLNSYIKLMKSSQERIDQWFLPVMAARLVESIPDMEKQFLLKEIRKRL